MKDNFNGTTQYARNKRQQVCMFEQFARVYKEKGLFLSMHPGWVDTEILKNGMPKFYKASKKFLKTP